MTVASEITRLQNSKAAIKAAIEAKGVPVDSAIKLDGFAAKIGEITQGGGAVSNPPTPYVRPADWIDISEVGDNEINLLVTSGTGIAFRVITSTGTFSIDWGDGVIETDRLSNTTYQHQHTTGGTWSTDGAGYYTWKIRIYGATGNITRFQMYRHTFTARSQYAPVLWANFGTTAITTYFNTFYSSNLYCHKLRECQIVSLASCSDISNMFNYCYSLASITLPATWGSVTNVSGMFYYCYSLASITLPATWGSVTNVSGMFYCCYSLASIVNLEYLGSQTVQSDFTNILNDCDFLITPIVIASRLSKIGVYGAIGYKLKVTSIRLTNTGSTFTGSSPQINVSYTDLNQAALVELFNDLPTLTSKSINITGCTGAAALTAAERLIATNKGWTITG